MIFAAPIKFEEAVQSRKVRALLPTDLSSRELSGIAAEIRERAFFSAKVLNAGFLQEAADALEQAAGGVSPGPGQYMNRAKFREVMRDFLKKTDYAAPEGKAGTIEDLSSDRRLNLIFDMGDRQGAGYGQWLQGQAPDIIQAFPCWELVRIFDRKEKRNWIERWRGAGGRFYDGRMIARKDDPIWERISAFNIPYPPFDFNSGMGLRAVARRECVRLGVMSDLDQVKPQSRGFNQDLEMAMPAQDAQLKAALMQDVGDVAELDGDTLKWKGSSDDVPGIDTLHAEPVRSQSVGGEADVARRISGVRSALERVLGRGRENAAEVPEIARVASAEIGSVIAGRKPLYHDAWGTDVSNELATALQEEGLPGQITAQQIGDQLVVYDRKRVENIFKADPSFYRPNGEDFDTALKRIVETGNYGELLGFGARKFLEGRSVQVYITEAGRTITDFRSRPGIARALAEAKMRDLERAGFSDLSYEIREDKLTAMSQQQIGALAEGVKRP